MAQWVKRPTLGFCSGHDLTVQFMRLSPTSGSALTEWSLLGIPSLSLCPSPVCMCACVHAHSLSLSLSLSLCLSLSLSLFLSLSLSLSADCYGFPGQCRLWEVMCIKEKDPACWPKWDGDNFVPDHSRTWQGPLLCPHTTLPTPEAWSSQAQPA